MPQTHIVPVVSDVPTYFVSKNGIQEPVYILSQRSGEVYVHYVNLDKRMDEWLPEDALQPQSDSLDASMVSSRKRKRSYSRQASESRTPSVRSSSRGLEVYSTDAVEDTESATAEIVMTEEDFDIQHHKQITAQRNFDKVNFGVWQIKTWYFSPYPLTESETDEIGLPTPTFVPGPKIPGVNRTSVRSHGRTSDLLAGGLQRSNASGEKSILWVCDKCFKYMADGLSWELHARICTTMHPPGRKVYQRGAHIIWEVDGAKDKLFCQNLSLFGKLFIDVKTLFFDCDNFLFYILTDADSQRDHVLAFFSKEKVSYDDYNLACIITFPPYQRRGYGMLLIEFSYELSRRAGKVGTPERPLSDLGLRSYLTFWVSTIIRFLRRLLSVIPPEKDQLVSIGWLPDLASAASPPVEDEMTVIRRKKRNKGWDGEAVDEVSGTLAATYAEDPLFSSMRTIVMKSNPDGSAQAHVYTKCTLDDIARATNLRVEDAAFALNECGLLDHIREEQKRSDMHARSQSDNSSRESNGDVDGEEEEEDGVEEVIVVTREMVEGVAEKRHLKRMMMDLRHVML